MSNTTSFSDIISRDFMEFIHNSSQSPQSLFNEINYALQFVSNVIIDTGGTIPQARRGFRSDATYDTGTTRYTDTHFCT